MNRVLVSVLPLMLSTAAMAAEEGHAGAATPFAGTIYQSLAAILVFVLLLVLLTRYAWGPILKSLQEREGSIKRDLEHARQGAEQATATLAKYQAQLAAAQAEAQKIIEQGRADAQRVAATLKQQTQDEIAEARKHAQQEIRIAKEQALGEIYTQTATLATQVAGKILRREISPEDQQHLVEESLAELGKEEVDARK